MCPRTCCRSHSQHARPFPGRQGPGTATAASVSLRRLSLVPLAARGHPHTDSHAPTRSLLIPSPHHAQVHVGFRSVCDLDVWEGAPFLPWPSVRAGHGAKSEGGCCLEVSFSTVGVSGCESPVGTTFPASSRELRSAASCFRLSLRLFSFCAPSLSGLRTRLFPRRGDLSGLRRVVDSGCGWRRAWQTPISPRQ